MCILLTLNVNISLHIKYSKTVLHSVKFYSLEHNWQYQLDPLSSSNCFFVILRHPKWNQELQWSHAIDLSTNFLTFSCSLHMEWHNGQVLAC